MGKRFLWYRFFVIVMNLGFCFGLILADDLQAKANKASPDNGSQKGRSKGAKSTGQGTNDPLAEKYRLEKKQRQKLRQKMRRFIPEKRYRKKGFVSSSTIQVHVVQDRSESPQKKRLSMDSPMRAINKRAQQVDNDNYFNALALMIQRLQKIRQKRGLPKDLPRDVRLDLLFYNRLQVKMRICDKQGRCIYVYSYSRPNLLQKIKKNIY